MADPFAALPRTPAGHFRLSLYAALFQLLARLHRLEQARGEDPEELYQRFPFLRGYLDQMRPYLPPGLTWADAAGWWEGALTDWEGAEPFPLRAFPALGYRHRLALMLIGLVEEDSRFGTLYAWLQQPVGQRRPTLELIDRLVDPNLCRPLLDAGLVAVSDRSAPRPEWELHVPERLWDAIRGETNIPPVDGNAILPGEIEAQLAALPPLLGSGQVKLVIVRGTAGSDRLGALTTIARALGAGIITADGPSVTDETLGPLAAMTRSLPVLTYDLGPGETAVLPTLQGYAGPVGVLLGLEGGLKGALADRSVTLTLPPPDLALRRRCWEQALGPAAASEYIEEIAARFCLPPGYIRQAAALAANRAALDGRESVTLTDVREAAGLLNRQLLDTLAVRLDPRGSWDDLVVGGSTALKLHELELRCRYREKLLDHVSPLIGAGGNRGVRALLAGPSGTGKTMAARTLAAVLGMDIYRVDLAAVVNKYIGETEKNLHQVLTRAEELDVILLLDEGDSLLARRSDVKSANDRYANLETNYLLQRLESYQGIVLITSNAAELIDPAFHRRMDVVVHFLAPEAAERAQIWRLHLPHGHAVDPAYVEEVAVRCALTGGQIRNAAMLASLLALDDGAPVSCHHLDEAIQSEYRKAGAISPMGEAQAGPARRPGLEAFMQAMRDEP